MQLSIIIVNYNVKYFLEQCLCSVLNACGNISAEIFVVDNNSTDGSRAFLEPRFPMVNFTWNSSNAGFAKANNQVIASAKGEYILFLNPDTIVPEDCFEKCFEFFKIHSDAGAIGIRMIDGTGKFLKESKRAFPSPLTSFYKLMGLAKLFPRSKTFAKYYLGHLPENENHEVDVLAGAFMLTPKKVIDLVGSFDEMFFMYGEDVDLSYRIQQGGFKNFYFSASTIIHFKGESTKKGSLNYVRLFYKAMSLFVKKHYSIGRSRFFNMLISASIFLHAMLAGLVKIFQGLRNKPSSQIARAVILSGKKEFDVVISLMERVGVSEKVQGRISIDENERENILGNIRQLSELINKNAVKEIIFCEEGLGFAAIIRIIEELPPGISNKFHASGSAGIVSSDNKDLSGEYIAD